MLQFELLLSRILALFDPLALKLGVDTDKLVHGLGCMLLSALCMLAGLGPFEAFLATLALGIAWEIASFIWRKVDPDPEDVLADFIGAAPLPAIVWLIGLLT